MSGPVCGICFGERCLGKLEMSPSLFSPDQKTLVPPFNVGELLPAQLEQYFRYNGSLTTPPCYQSVLWTVFNRRAQISMGQVSDGEVKEENCCNSRPFPIPKVTSLTLLSWKSFRRHCSPQKRSPLSPSYRTIEPPSLSISGLSLLHSPKVTLQGSEEMGNQGLNDRN